MKRILMIAVLILTSSASAADKPNIVFILADDLGSADLGCYGQTRIRTPFLDQMAREGLKFTRFYAGNAVCAPSRCVLMTGKHAGHAYVRDNREAKPEGQAPIPADATTVATILKRQGYVTGAFGKWGLGPPGSSGDPLRHGFDRFYGYNCQRHAHTHYPDYLWDNERRVALDGRQFSHDLMEAEALKFIETSREKPFFLYVPFTVPHVALQVPEDSLEEYRGKFADTPYDGKQGYRPHPTPHAAYAAMVTRLDRSVGRILTKLKDLHLDKNTIVFFSSDNGPTHGRVGGADSAFFKSAGELRGLKGSLYEGGIRVPLLARWPGKIKPGTSDFIGAFCDVLPTLADVAGAAVPNEVDGISFLPTLLGTGTQKTHEFLYWEFPGYGGQQALRSGPWKAVRTTMNKGNLTFQLYNLDDDPNETNDVAARHPAVLARLTKILAEQHTPSKLFPLKGVD